MEKQSVSDMSEEKELLVTTKGNEGKEEKNTNQILGVNLEQEKLDKKMRTIVELVCHICSHQLENKKLYLSHIREHRVRVKNKTFYICLELECLNILFKNKEEAGNHYVELHEKKIQCLFCRKYSNRKELLRMHQRISHNVYEYKCEECDFITYEGSYFQMHIRCHQENLDYKCRYCSFTFNDIQLVVYHEENHHKK